MLFIFLCEYSSCYSTLFQNVLRTLRHYLRLFQKGLPREASFELVLEMCDDLYTLCIDFVCFTKHSWGWTTYCESSQSGVLTIWLLRFKLFHPLPVGVSWGSILFLVKGDVDQLWFCKELHLWLPTMKLECSCYCETIPCCFAYLSFLIVGTA